MGGGGGFDPAINGNQRQYRQKKTGQNKRQGDQEPALEEGVPFAAVLPPRRFDFGAVAHGVVEPHEFKTSAQPEQDHGDGDAEQHQNGDQ